MTYLTAIAPTELDEIYLNTLRFLAVDMVQKANSGHPPRFSANRTVREYTDQHYLPAAAAYRDRAANKGALGRQVFDWQHGLEQKWATLHVGEVTVETHGGRHVFEVPVCLNGLDPGAVRVELYANGAMASAPLRQEMKRVRQLTGASGGYVYSAAVLQPTRGLYGARDTTATAL
jgi:starch phosphorylase